MPGPGVRGSSIAKTRPAPACERRDAGDVRQVIEGLMRACAGNLRPIGPLTQGAQAAGEPAARFPLAARAGRCYRAFLATDATDVSVTVLDSGGHVAAEAWAQAVPHEGVLCFEKDDAAQVVISIGRGKAAFALQIAEAP